MNFTINQLKEKIKELNYKGKLPTKKQELIQLYEKILNNSDLDENTKSIPVKNTGKMTVIQLKEKIKELNYKGKLPTQKQELIQLYEKILKINSTQEEDKEKETDLDDEDDITDKEITLEEFQKISKFTINQIRILFQQKNYIGKLPNRKQELLDLFKKVFVNEDESSSKNYDSLSLQEIIEELRRQNITHNLPRKKQLLLNMLKASKCNPMENKWCDENKICDVMNNICVNNVEQNKQTTIHDVINGHNVLGSKHVIQNIKDNINRNKINISVSNIPDIDIHTVETKEQLLLQLKRIQKNTLDNVFINFLKSVV